MSLPKTPAELNAEFVRIAADLGDGIAEAVASAVAENERRIVAWLRGFDAKTRSARWCIQGIADRIERGEHRRKEG